MTGTRRLWCALVAGFLLPALLGLVSPGPASGMSSSYLCTGYQGCRAAGYSDAGYGASNRTMYWRMYAGHNCTNYVAYRLIRNGMSSERPWTSTGMAYNWGPANPGKTDRTPRVGSVAWWGRNAPGAGSSGHVAYVERVVSSNEIVISEDSWSGDFHWRRIVKSASGWPTGFIHFKDREVVNTAVPQINGTPRVGAPLTAKPGGWTPAGTYTYQWLADGRAVAGATGPSFTPRAEQRGARLSVRVNARRSGYAAGSARSAAGARVAPGKLTSTSTPVVTGDPEVDQVLRVTTAGWSPRPQSTEVRWRADGVRIEGESERTLRVRRSFAGAMISAVIVARRPGYRKSSAAAAPVGPVVAGTIEVNEPFTVAGRPRVGHSLSIKPGRFTPGDARVTYAWLRHGRPIAGATGATYQPGAADLGAWISARVTLSKQDHVDLSRTLSYDRIVTTMPEVVPRTVGRQRAAAVGVRVVAPGMAEPRGEVRVEVGSKRTTARLVDGRVRVVLRGLEPGQRRVVVTYLGTRVVERAVARATVRVRAR